MTTETIPTHCTKCGGRIVWVQVSSTEPKWFPTCLCLLRKERDGD